MYKVGSCRAFPETNSVYGCWELADSSRPPDINRQVSSMLTLTSWESKYKSAVRFPFAKGEPVDEFKSCFLEMATVSDFNRRMGIHTLQFHYVHNQDPIPSWRFAWTRFKPNPSTFADLCRLFVSIFHIMKRIIWKFKDLALTSSLYNHNPRNYTLTPRIVHFFFLSSYS